MMLCGRDELALERAVRRLRGRPGDVAATACDLVAPDTPNQLVAAVRSHFGTEVDLDRLLSLAARLLPPAGGAPEHGVPGVRAAAGHRPGGPVHRLTALGRRAARATNQPTAS
ncbi:hypothetical protein ACFYUY_23040 [Kitasatospora sp. NPDC004745]|uniref:hypothetical protein n=1 Tax=Kitasatospora sp. NPDC004745 TaxID=3364019 RepID=UPI0036C28D05